MNEDRDSRSTEALAPSGAWSEFVHFLKHEKKWWLGSTALLLLILAMWVAQTGDEGLVPPIYEQF